MIDQLAVSAPFILLLSGGEPLFRRDIFRLARRATDKGIRVSLATNGTLITESVAQEICDAGIRRVAISLDGPDAATHDAFRGMPGSFQRALEGFQYLRQRGMSLQINSTVAKHNSARLQETLDLALRLGADAFHLFLLVRQRRAEARHHGESVPELSTHHGHGGHAPTAMNAMTRGCLAGTGVCFVSHKGEVYPCGYLPLEAGNLHRQSFTEVWERSPLFASLRDIENLKGKCGACEFRYICEGCRARALGCTGDYLAEEPFCLYEPRDYQPAAFTGHQRAPDSFANSI